MKSPYNVDSQKTRVENAIIEGNYEEFARLRQQMVDASGADDPETSVNNNVKGYLKELYTAGQINDERVYEYMQKIGVEEESIFKTMNNWEYGSNSEYAAVYSNLEDLFESGSSDRTKLVDSCKELLKYKDKEAIKKQLQSKYKKVYLESTKKSNMKSALLSALRAIGYTEKEANEIINGWK